MESLWRKSPESWNTKELLHKSLDERYLWLINTRVLFYWNIGHLEGLPDRILFPDRNGHYMSLYSERIPIEHGYDYNEF